MALSDDKIVAVINLWNEGKSSNDIAKIFHVTRGTIVGVIYRARQRGLDVKQKAPSKPKALPPKEEVPRVEAKPKRKKMEVLGAKVMLKVVSELEPTIYNLRKGQCKYPTHFSADNEQLFCAAPTERVYCDKHHNICHVQKEPYRLKSLGKLR